MSQSRRAVTHLGEWRKARRAKQTQLFRLMTSQGLRRRLTSGQGKMRSVRGRRRGGHQQRSRRTSRWRQHQTVGGRQTIGGCGGRRVVKGPTTPSSWGTRPRFSRARGTTQDEAQVESCMLAKTELARSGYLSGRYPTGPTLNAAAVTRVCGRMKRLSFFARRDPELGPALRGHT